MTDRLPLLSRVKDKQDAETSKICFIIISTRTDMHANIMLG